MIHVLFLILNTSFNLFSCRVCFAIERGSVYFLGAYRETAGTGHDFSLSSDLQHVQGPIDATISARVFYYCGLDRQSVRFSSCFFQGTKPQACGGI